jgi:hypothetical protein
MNSYDGIDYQCRLRITSPKSHLKPLRQLLKLINNDISFSAQGFVIYLDIASGFLNRMLRFFPTMYHAVPFMSSKK